MVFSQRLIVTCVFACFISDIDVATRGHEPRLIFSNSAIRLVKDDVLCNNIYLDVLSGWPQHAVPLCDNFWIEPDSHSTDCTSMLVHDSSNLSITT